MLARHIFVVSLFCFCVVDVLSQRIVSLAPSVTQVLVQIGAGDKVVGRTSYCPSVAGASVVGDAMNFNVEAIYSLHPDLVVAMSFASPSVVTKLRALGLNVQLFQSPSSFEEVCEQTIVIGRLSNSLDSAMSVVNAEKDAVCRLCSTGSSSGSMFFQIGTKPVWGVYPSLYMHDFIRFSGFQNILSEGNGMTSREFVVTSSPDVIVMTTMGGLSDSETKVWKSMLRSKIIVVDENLASCPTPTNFRIVLKTIIEQL